MNCFFSHLKEAFSPRYKRLQLLKGYRLVRATYGLSYIKDLRNSLSDLALPSAGLNLVFNLFSLPILPYQVCQQVLKLNILQRNSFCSELLRAVASSRYFIYPLPLSCLLYIQSQGIQVGILFSSILWRYTCILYSLNGLRFLILCIVRIFFHKRTPSPFRDSRECILFHDVPSSFLDLDIIHSRQTLFDWVKVLYPQTDAILVSSNSYRRFRYSGINIHFHPTSFLPCNISLSIKFLVMYVPFLLFVIIFSPLLPFSFTWASFLAKDLVITSLVHLTPNSELPRRAIFVSSWVYRPIWSYLLQKHLVSVEFAFYSVNNEGFGSDGKNHSPYFDMRHLTWPYVHAWNTYHRSFLQKSGNFNTVYTISPPFTSVDNGINLSSLPSRSIAVFDLSPRPSSIRYELGSAHAYLNPYTVISFLNDIMSLCELYNVYFIHKQKRVIPSSQYDNTYTNYLNVLSDSDKYISLHPGSSVTDILQRTSASISFPFTSVPHFSPQDKLAFYYDPKCFLSSRLNAAQGIPLIRGGLELKSVFATLFSV